MSRNIGGKLGEVFDKGALSQIKPDGKGFKILTHLDHLEENIKSDIHIEDSFTNSGKYREWDFTIKESK